VSFLSRRPCFGAKLHSDYTWHAHAGEFGGDLTGRESRCSFAVFRTSTRCRRYGQRLLLLELCRELIETGRCSKNKDATRSVQNRTRHWQQCREPHVIGTVRHVDHNCGRVIGQADRNLIKPVLVREGWRRCYLISNSDGNVTFPRR